MEAAVREEENRDDVEEQRDDEHGRAFAGPEVVAPIKPSAGLLILFPAWLSHSVQPWDGGDSRISIAMNIRSAAPAAVAPPGRQPKISKSKPDKDR
jgi:hypothetical protein